MKKYIIKIILSFLKEKNISRVFTVTVKGSKEKAQSVLSKLSKTVKNLKFVSEEKNKVTFRFESDRKDDIREDISFALSDARLLVLSMSEEQSSLEDIYLAYIEEADRKFEEEMIRKKMEAEAEKASDDEDDEDEEEEESVKEKSDKDETGESKDDAEDSESDENTDNKTEEEDA